MVRILIVIFCKYFGSSMQLIASKASGQATFENKAMTTNGV